MKFTSFRKKKRLTGQNLELLKQIIEEEVSKYLKVIEIENIGKHNIKLKKYLCNSLLDVELGANEFRKYIKLSERQPMSDLINILENLGIIIIQIKNTNNRFNDFDGLSEIVNDIPVIVLLGGIKDGARQRFTIAHELGHLVLNINNSELDEEKLCNKFASALLMLKEAVVSEFGLSRNNINFFELKAFKNELKVSYAAIVYRLRDLNIISEYLYKKLNILLSQRIGKNNPEFIEPEISFQYKKLVYKLEASKVISINKACELLGVTVNEYNEEVNNY